MINSILINEYDALVCPNCIGDNLHHSEVRSIFRDTEDGNGTFVAIDRKRIIKERWRSDKIPGRRDIVVIKFWCETCDKTSYLKIQQHKGKTYFEWGWK